MKYNLFSFCLSFVFSFCSLAQSGSINTVIGFAPKYIGQKVEVYGIEDYLSQKEFLIASAVVGEDSTFKVSFFNDITRKIAVRSNNNKGYLYIDPDMTYNIYLPDRNRFDEYRPLGNEVEIAFRDLPESDINFKILSFDKWCTNFLGEYFYKKNVSGLEFVQKLDTFKMDVAKAYIKDTNFFFKTYVRFSIAGLDEIQFKGARNRFEKHDFYIKNYPFSYQNPVFMDYINSFYENIDDHLPMETTNKIYLAVLKSSPTLLINAIGDEPTLSSVRLREYAMIKLLGEHYFKNDFPQTNILSILDSLSNFSLYPEHKSIAKNLIKKLTEISIGTKAPDFTLNNGTQSKTNRDFFKKHLYIQFLDPSMLESEREVDVLVPLYAKYKDYINIITVYRKQKDYTPKQEVLLKQIPWDKFEVEADNPILRNYAVFSYPYYVLLDHTGHVVAAPALRPSPNGKYETIEKSFFYIQKYLEEERKNEH